MRRQPAVERRRRVPGTRPRPRPRGRLGLVAGLFLLPLVLGGCDLPNFLGFHGATTQGHVEHLLWAGTFIAALVVGGIVLALILWAIVFYRARSDEIPRQFQYHIPLEITYTVVPIVIVLVLFGFTVIAENKIDDVSAPTVQTVDVSAFQWGWQFRYVDRGVVVQGETLADPDPVGLNGKLCAPNWNCLGPGLVLPVGQNVLINLRSKDTIHGFYVPEFNFSRYAQPGILNQFQLTATHVGIYRAQCTQFCGLYHSEMFFHVVTLPPKQFRAWLAVERRSQARAVKTRLTNAAPSAPSTANSPGAPSAPGAPSTAANSSNSYNPGGGGSL